MLIPSVVLGALGFTESVVEFKTDVDVPVCAGINSEELLEELFRPVINVDFDCSASSVELYVIDEVVLVIVMMTLDDDDAKSGPVGAGSSVCSEIVLYPDY